MRPTRRTRAKVLVSQVAAMLDGVRARVEIASFAPSLRARMMSRIRRTYVVASLSSIAVWRMEMPLMMHHWATADSRGSHRL